MSRLLPILVGLAVLVAAGVVHGLWTDRWRPSAELAEAAARLDELPADVGAWKGKAQEQDPEMLEVAGAAAHYSRSFLDPKTGERVLVLLLVGRANRMVVHRPEDCYQAAGYDLAGAPARVRLRPEGEAEAEFLTGLFTRDAPTSGRGGGDWAGPSQLRIFWSFHASGRWSAPASPRWQFAREKVLYKLYVIREASGPAEQLSGDPCVRLLGELLPVLDWTIGEAKDEGSCVKD